MSAVFVFNNLQHEILFPAWLVPPHSNSCAFDILHLQRDVGVELVWNKEKGKMIVSFMVSIIARW